MFNQRHRCEDFCLPGDILSHETLHQDPQVNADEEGHQRLVSSDGSWTYFTADCAWIGSDLRGRMLRSQALRRVRRSAAVRRMSLAARRQEKRLNAIPFVSEVTPLCTPSILRVCPRRV
ncbi:hypothetical protein SAVCW2_00460 [Streptomyces avermitilis]|nr:hypothetical protein SAVCW2_00460 [Streptomyces avermitilis]